MRIKYILSKDARVKSYNEYISDNYPQFVTEKNPELLLVAGGDGAMLHAIQQCQNADIAFFGKALGTVNFLMNKMDDDQKILDEIISNNITLHFQTTQSIDILVNDKPIGFAVNDILLGDSINAYHKFCLESSDKSFDGFEVKGTGLVISTTLGSTAYNYNNGGNILPLESNLWSITGVVTSRYINDIVNQQKIEITVDGGNLYADGIKIFSSKVEYKVTINPGRVVKLAFIDKSVLHSRRVDFGNRLRQVKE